MLRALEIITHAIVIGAGATAVMDLWAASLRRVWRVPSLDYALLGRWIGHFPSGHFMHESIASAAPVRHERVIGWSAHHAIGIMFAALLLLVWARNGSSVRHFFLLSSSVPGPLSRPS